MGLFSKMLGTNDAGAQASIATPVVSLEKSKISLDKTLVNLSKGSKVDLTKHQARVGMVLDYSGSMRGLYSSGAVQRVITRLLPLAIRFDDDGKLESWLFANGCKQLDSVSERNYANYVNLVVSNSRFSMGGTEYAPVLKSVRKYYVEQEPSSLPAFVVFITDGDNSDHEPTDEIVRLLSKDNLFVQFVGIGGSSFKYLEKLDDLSGRERDNTGFIKVRDMDRMSDEELYTELLKQYKDWLAGNQ